MNTALLLIDIQNDYFPGGSHPLANPEIAARNAKKMLDRFRAGNGEIIHIRHIAARPGATYFLPGTPGSEIHSLVAPAASEKTVIKHFPNSFRETDLLPWLQTRNISGLILCGMMTHMCVDSTTRAAKDLGFACTLIGDACATRDLTIDGRIVPSAAVHDAFLAALGHFYATVTTTAQFLKEQ